MAQDIVVTGKRIKALGGGVTWTYTSVTVTSTATPTGYTDSTDAQGNSVREFSVAIHVTNSSNATAAQTAAQNVAQAIIIIVDKLKAASPSAVITFPDGSQRTVQNMLDTVANTTFQVTDNVYDTNSNPAQYNGGVGAADFESGVDYLTYTSFDGGPDHDYADPSWQGQGMLGIMLHEIVHMDISGYENRAAEIHFFNEEHALRHDPSNIVFQSSEYARDNERYADQSAVAIAATIGLDISAYAQQSPYAQETYSGGETLYYDRNPE